MSGYINSQSVLIAGGTCDHPATLEGIMRAAVEGQVVLPVVGDCMEDAGIEDGGFVAVDFTHCPRPGRRENGVFVHGDPCLCYAVFPGMDAPTIMCKEYCGVWLGQMVGTRYENWEDGKCRINCCFTAEAILGVVYAAWGKDRRLKWQYDPTDLPTELPKSCTIKGGNVAVESVRRVRGTRI